MRKVMSGRRSAALAAGLVAIAAAVAAGLGTADAQSSSSVAGAAPPKGVWFGGEPGITPSTGARGRYDAAEGIKAAQRAGKPVKLPKKKAGILQIVGAVVSAQRAERGLQAALKAIGWSFVRCDAQGDPAKMEACGQSLLNQKIDVLFNLGVEPSLINGTLQRAQRENVLVIAFGGMVTGSPLEYNYGPNEAAVGELLATHMVSELNKLPGTKPIAIWDFPAVWATARTKRLRKKLETNPSIQLKHDSTVDGLNVVDGTRAGVAAQLTQTPNLKGIWIAFDSAAFGAAQAIAQKFPGKSFPDSPCIYTFHADQPNLEAMRRGDICALSDSAYDNSGWISVDQAAEWFARKRKPSRKLDGGYGKSVNFMQPILVTRTRNLPPPGKFVEAPNSAVTFFKAKWKAEFGIGK